MDKICSYFFYEKKVSSSSAISGQHDAVTNPKSDYYKTLLLHAMWLQYFDSERVKFFSIFLEISTYPEVKLFFGHFESSSQMVFLLFQFLKKQK